MKKLSRLTWSEAYSVHDDTIDAQHRKLFDIVNQLSELYETRSDDLLPVLTDLVDYLYVHFNAEQMVMMNANYPRYIEHNKEHQVFTEKIHEFLKSYEEGKKGLAFEMINFLREWVDTHTLTSDGAYGKHLDRRLRMTRQSYKTDI